jgi:plastocyanin
VRRILVLVSALTIASCGGGGSPSGPSGGGTNAATITITSSGVAPSQVTVAAGSRVLFLNSDSRSHNMTSDPHPEHTDCPEINTVGLLQPGQSRETGNLVAIRTCGFHDHDDPPPSGTRWRGTITTR